MLEFEKKRRVSRIAYSVPALIALGVLFLFVANATWGVFATYREARANRARADEELAALEGRRWQLAAEVARLKTPEGVEAAIREKYGLVKKGEGVIIVVDESAAAATAGGEEEGFWASLWRSIRGIFARD